jgi:hypothetical protein
MHTMAAVVDIVVAVDADAGDVFPHHQTSTTPNLTGGEQQLFLAAQLRTRSVPVVDGWPLLSDE